MISPVDQPPTPAVPRSTDPPTLWLSLVLGSVLIHLVLFILGTLALTRTATVQLTTEPITIELVDPTAVTARSSTPNQSIAARPGAPSSTTPSTSQAQPNTARSHPSETNPAVEQPFVQPLPRRRLPVRTQEPKPSSAPAQSSRNPAPLPSTPANNSTQPPPTSTRNPFPPSDSSETRQPQPPSDRPGERLPGSLPNPLGGSEPLPADSQPPATGERISHGPQEESVFVKVTNFSPPSVDISRQPAQPSVFQQNLFIRYPSALSTQTINLQAALIIDQNGKVLSVEKATLLSSSLGSTIDEETLTTVANQIFTQWQFNPAQDRVDGKLVKPPQSNLVVNAQVQIP